MGENIPSQLNLLVLLKEPSHWDWMRAPVEMTFHYKVDHGDCHMGETDFARWLTEETEISSGKQMT